MSDLIEFLAGRVMQGIAEGARQRAQSRGAPPRPASASASAAAPAPPASQPPAPANIPAGTRQAARAARRAAREARFTNPTLFAPAAPPVPPPPPSVLPPPLTAVTGVPPGTSVQPLSGAAEGDAGRMAVAQPLPGSEEAPARPTLAAFLANRDTLRHAVVAAEILGPPIALREGEPSRRF